MEYTGPVFRPPFEDGSLLLQATVGCSHNKCTFCSMYRDVPFRVEDMAQIERDLMEVRDRRPWYRRVFLLGGDAFVLEADRLKAIAKRCKDALPHLETVTMYASINNIRSKTDQELRELRAMGIDDLNIGFETALDDRLAHFDKGFTVDEARTQLLRLKDAGMDFSLNIIIGAAGMDRALENAAANARFLNEIEPALIFVATMHMDKDTPLRAELEAGLFVENTIGQNILEEMELLRGLTARSFFYGRHVSNVIGVQGNLPDDKEAMLRYMEEELREIPEDYLAARPTRGAEGVLLA